MGPWYDEAYFRQSGQPGRDGLLTDLNRNRDPRAPRPKDRITLPAAAIVLLLVGAAGLGASLTGGTRSNGQMIAQNDDHSSRL